MDIKKYTNEHSTLDLETAKTISGNPSLTREELKSFKETAKDKQEIKSNI